ncbi:MAG TPA: universal stress protein [Mycobacteriales bacterium]|nr:universal stress protein [Mycobacteriales bacterium]
MTSPAVFKRVLVGFDGSPASRHALAIASDLAGSDGEVVALAVLDPTGPAESADGVPAVDGAGPLWVARCFDDALATLPGSVAQFRVLGGRRVAAGLSEYADTHGFDLLVVGRRSNPAVGVGHIPEALMRNERLAVLLAPEPA